MKDRKQSRLNQLHLDQERLRASIHASEHRINEQITYLEDHFGTMVLNSVLPFKPEERENVSSLLNTVNGFFSGFRKNKSDDESETSSSGFMKSVQMLVAGIVYRYLKKMF